MNQRTYKNRLAIVVATKDRPEQLRSVLSCIQGQSFTPDQIVVVDGGDRTVAEVAQEFGGLPIDYITVRPPGLTRQKNAGVAAARPENNLVAMVDDDMVFDDGSFAVMMDFWEEAPQDMGGACFNLPDFENTKSRLKSLPQRLFFIDNSQMGRVHRSGFNTPIWNVKDDSLVQWLGGGYTVWRKQVFDHLQFDEWFKGSGLWEDVRFSRQVARDYRLAIVAKATATHVDAPVTPDRQLSLGKTQIVNWMYYVNNDGDLSVLMCLWACIGRTGTNLAKGIVKLDRGLILKGVGNFLGLLSSALGASRSGRGGNTNQALKV